MCIGDIFTTRILRTKSQRVCCQKSAKWLNGYAAFGIIIKASRSTVWSALDRGDPRSNRGTCTAASSEAAFFMPKNGQILKGQLNMGGRGAVSSSRRGINATSIGSWLQGRGDDGEKFNEENFMNSTIANFISVSEPFDYQSECHCSKTDVVSDEQRISLITSQNATAPKPRGSNPQLSASLITSQNATAPKPYLRDVSVDVGLITNQNATAPKPPPSKNII